MKSLDYLNDQETKSLLSVISTSRDQAITRLLLDAGLFLNEICALRIDSIDWINRMLKVEGVRERELPLSDELYDSLLRWVKERPKTSLSALFITQKGKPSAISSRTIGNLMHNYGTKAGLSSAVNPQVLRNTFAVRLFRKEVSLDVAAKLLGLEHPKTIRRYLKAAKEEVGAEKLKGAIRKLEPRGNLVKKLTRRFRRGVSKVPDVSGLSRKTEMQELDLVQGTVGRDGVLEEIDSYLKSNRSVLLTGELGLGKSHLLRQVARDKEALYFSSPTPLRGVIQVLCDRYVPDWKNHLSLKGRSSSMEMLVLLSEVIKKSDQRPILVIDNLSRLKVSDQESFLSLFDHFRILGAVEEPLSRLKKIWWKFRSIKLKPLGEKDEKRLIRSLTSHLTISDYAMLENRILVLANGNPLAIVELIAQLSDKSTVSYDQIKRIYHEAGICYRGWTSILIFIWGATFFSRFVALGSHNFEGYIISGFAMASIITLIRFLRGRK